MLSEERVKHMTKMAIFEKNEARKMAPAIHYRRKDYLGLVQIAHVFLGTILYVLVAAIVFGALFSTVLTNLHTMTLVIGLLVLLLLYVFFLFWYLHRARVRFDKRYTEGLELVKKLREDYRILDAMYEAEEFQKSPSGWEEE